MQRVTEVTAAKDTKNAEVDKGNTELKQFEPNVKGEPQALQMLHDKEIDLVVNIPKNLSPTELGNGHKIRRAAIDLNIPLLTNARLASAFINAFTTLPLDDIEIKPWDEY